MPLLADTSHLSGFLLHDTCIIFQTQSVTLKSVRLKHARVNLSHLSMPGLKRRVVTVGNLNYGYNEDVAIECNNSTLTNI